MIPKKLRGASVRFLSAIEDKDHEFVDGVSFTDLERKVRNDIWADGGVEELAKYDLELPDEDSDDA